MSQQYSHVPPRASAPRSGVDTGGYPLSDDDRMYQTRLPNSTRRYTTTQQAVIRPNKRDVVIFEGEWYFRGQPQQPLRRSAASAPPTTDHQPAAKERRRVHWLVFFGGAMLLMLVGWVALSEFSLWWQTVQDDWHYGKPRTYQCDAVVGHHDSVAHPSHFIALNLKGRISVIEFPGGDETKAKIYPIAQLEGTNQDLTSATLTFVDVNGDTKLDMIVTVGSSRFVFINDQGQFRPLRAGDQIMQPGR